MRLDSGILYLKRLSNSAEAGLMPVMTETQIGVYCYAERVVGFSRFYEAKQADEQVDMIVRIPRIYAAKTGDRVRLSPYACIAPENPYIVVQVQQVTDEETNLPATDLSLRAMAEADKEVQNGAV